MARSAKSEAARTPKNVVQKGRVATAEKAPAIDPKAIFDERHKLFMDNFKAMCERERVPVAIAVVVDPKIPQGPLVHLEGDDYWVVKTLALVLRQLKERMLKELEA